MRGITLGEWVRNYGLEPFPVTAEEIAFGVIERNKWPATPELVLNLITMIEAQGLKKE